jgi:hypothetical protein
VNIFYLDHDVKKCAEMHNDKHCVKMILEYAQLLSTTHRILDGVLSTGVSPTGRKKTVYALADNRDSILYSATHVNHPSCVWVRQSDKNYDWLFALFQSLMDEYTYRYGKVHACTKLEMALARIPENMPWAPFTEPTPAMPDDCKVIGNSIASYRNYYIMNKTHLAKWKNRPIPEWYNDNTPRIYEPQAS